MNFCEKTYELLVPDAQGSKLTFVAPTSGNKYDAGNNDTILHEKTAGGSVYEISKFGNELRVAAFNPVNPRKVLDKGCDKCGRKVVSFIRVGENHIVFNACVCGNIWG